MWCWLLALQDHDAVINVIDAVVAGIEMSSGVAGMRTKMVWIWHWAVAHSTLELLRPGMLGRQVKTGMWQEPWRRYWRPNAVAGENKSRTLAWSPPRSIQGQYHADSDTPCHCVWGGAASPLKNFLSLAWLANLLLYLKKSELIGRRVHRYNYNSA